MPPDYTAPGIMAAVYRATPGADWQDCELIGAHDGGMLVLREIDKPFPGVWLANLSQVRIPCGSIDQPEIHPRKYLPKDAARWGRYRVIRELFGRDEALRQVFGSP